MGSSNDKANMVELLGIAEELLTEADKALAQSRDMASQQEAALREAEVEVADLTEKVRRLMIQCLDTREQRDALMGNMEIIRDLVTCDDMGVEEALFRIFEVAQISTTLNS